MAALGRQLAARLVRVRNRVRVRARVEGRGKVRVRGSPRRKGRSEPARGAIERDTGEMYGRWREI